MTANHTQAAEPLCETRDLSLFWRGRSKALRILDSQRHKSDPMTLETARVYDECAAELDAALNSASPAAGDWVLVPREPTEAMTDAAEVSQLGKRWDPTEIYRAMLNAAPAHPIPAQAAEAANAIFDLMRPGTFPRAYWTTRILAILRHSAAPGLRLTEARGPEREDLTVDDAEFGMKP